MTPPLPTRADVVIIGGGIVGCSIAYHLTKLGITDVLLLERRQLTCGTTWHAAGLIGQLRATRRMTELAKYTSELLHALEAETGQATGFKQNGSISLALNAERFEELKRGASMAKNFGLAVEVIGPAEIKARYPAARGRRRGGRGVPAQGRAGQPDRHDPGLRQGCPAAGRAHRRGREGPAHPGRAGQGGRRADRTGPDRRYYRRARRRHVVARAGGCGRGLGAAARGRALLHRHRAPGGGAARPAGAAGHRRVHLLQGGRRQAPGRRLRARGQALGHGRHPRGLLLRQPARGHGPLRADPRERHAPPADPGHRRHPDLLQRPRELHPRRPLSPRRDRRGPRPVRRLRLQLDRHPELGRCRQGAGRMDPRPPHAGGPDRRRRAPAAPVPEQPQLPARPHHRDAGPALRHALALPAIRHRARRAPLAVPRPAGRGRCGDGRDGGLGAAELVRAGRGRARVCLLLGPAELVRAHGRRVPGACGTAWRCSTSRASPSSWSRAPTPAPC